MDGILINAFWFVLGAAAGWVIQHAYYRMSRRDFTLDRVAAQVDWPTRITGCYWWLFWIVAASPCIHS